MAQIRERIISTVPTGSMNKSVDKMNNSVDKNPFIRAQSAIVMVAMVQTPENMLRRFTSSGCLSDDTTQSDIRAMLAIIRASDDDDEDDDDDEVDEIDDDEESPAIVSYTANQALEVGRGILLDSEYDSDDSFDDDVQSVDPLPIEMGEEVQDTLNSVIKKVQNGDLNDEDVVFAGILRSNGYSEYDIAEIIFEALPSQNEPEEYDSDWEQGRDWEDHDEL